MTTKHIIKLIFILTISSLIFFGLKGLVYAMLSAGIVFFGFVVFCFSWGVIIFLSDKFCD